MSNYTATHMNIEDFSTAMEIDFGSGLYLMNENGDQWQADPMEWREMLDYTASACDNCGIVKNAKRFAKACPCCKSTKGHTLVTVAPMVGITA